MLIRYIDGTRAMILCNNAEIQQNISIQPVAKESTEMRIPNFDCSLTTKDPTRTLRK